MIFVTSDLHLGHSNIIKLNGRPFENVDEMNRVLIQNWNAVVGRNDEVYVLGDLIYKASITDANAWLKKLNGVKYLIKGNHDKYLNQPEFNQDAFRWVKDYFVLPYKDAKFVLFHYPIQEWDGYFRKTAHLYGHVHTNLVRGQDIISESRAINVGVDVNEFMPVSIEALYKRAFSCSWRGCQV